MAVRAVRLAKLSRSEPDSPAAAEFSPAEIEAALIATHRTRSSALAPTLGEITHCIAQLGGYIGKSSGGPPGATVIKRGLERIHFLALHLAEKAGKQ